MTINRPSAAVISTTGKPFGPLPFSKKATGQMGAGSDIPEDAIPSVEIPSFIESLLGSPRSKMVFLPPDKMVQNLQIAVYGVLVTGIR